MGQKRELHIFAESAAAHDFLVKRWGNVARRAIANRGRFTVALSGGKTPGDFFTRLAEMPNLPWDETHIFQVDERFVDPTDIENNMLLIKEALISRVSIPNDNIYPITTEGITPEESAREYEQELRRFFHNDTLPRFDLIMLGIGNDGHSASLFPGSPCLHETKRLVVSVVAKGPPRERISLTLPVINHARSVVFLATGERKAPVMREILEEKDSSLPAAQVRPDKGSLLFVLDNRAASLLSQRTSD
ncbi:MAG: 6-phosphogluconolactonase [Deltaproteobacteria bacterium]|nr:6-phosphogluconolactonase [Deltaproteobacteria bacterium]